ncbi:MAG: hypothetical protein MUP45_01660 [Candidatus Marinimicrobia bacterium]|nr:hypothetical protein [Candidatus Neomarinimicrobiota bacterium]
MVKKKITQRKTFVKPIKVKEEKFFQEKRPASTVNRETIYDEYIAAPFSGFPFSTGLSFILARFVFPNQNEWGSYP